MPAQNGSQCDEGRACCVCLYSTPSFALGPAAKWQRAKFQEPAAWVSMSRNGMCNVPNTVPDTDQNGSWHVISHLCAFVWYNLRHFCLSEFFHYIQICFLDKCLFSKASSMVKPPASVCVLLGILDAFCL